MHEAHYHNYARILQVHAGESTEATLTSRSQCIRYSLSYLLPHTLFCPLCQVSLKKLSMSSWPRSYTALGSWQSPIQCSSSFTKNCNCKVHISIPTVSSFLQPGALYSLHQFFPSCQMLYEAGLSCVCRDSTYTSTYEQNRSTSLIPSFNSLSLLYRVLQRCSS